MARKPPHRSRVRGPTVLERCRARLLRVNQASPPQTAGYLYHCRKKSPAFAPHCWGRTSITGKPTYLKRGEMRRSLRDSGWPGAEPRAGRASGTPLRHRDDAGTCGQGRRVAERRRSFTPERPEGSALTGSVIKPRSCLRSQRLYAKHGALQSRALSCSQPGHL